MSTLLIAGTFCVYYVQAQTPTLQMGGSFDLQGTDSYICTVFRERVEAEYVRAAERYLLLLEQSDRELHSQEQEIVHRHVAQMLFLLPDEFKSRIMEHEEDFYGGKGKLKEGAGALLVAWWRSQDPLPGTLWNERIAEHLERVAVAEERYPYRTSLMGFDERGEIYVRLGEPSRVEKLYSVNSQKTLSLLAPFPPRNEYWIYNHLGQHAQYLFVWRAGRYQISTPEELLPTYLRTGFEGARGEEKAALAAITLHDYYNRLAFFNPEYQRLHFKLQEVMTAQQRVATEEGTTVTRLLEHSGVSFTRDIPSLPGIGYGFLFDARRVEDRLRKLRSEAVPEVHTEVFSTPTFKVNARLARFLDEDGTTRTELYWSIPPPELTPSLGTQLALLRAHDALSHEYVLLGSAAQQHRDFKTRQITRAQYRLSETSEGVLPVQMTAVRGDTGLYHVALQWDQYMLWEDGEHPESASTSSYLKTSVLRADSLQALSLDPGTLEMSDLVPLVADPLVDPPSVREEEGFRVPVHVFETIKPNDELALYFEAYHLTFGPDDQTHYTVAYEVTRREKQRGLPGLLGKQKEHVTASSTRYTGRSRTAREYMVLDLGQWRGEGSLAITVSLTDEITKQVVERMITFEAEHTPE